MLYPSIHLTEYDRQMDCAFIYQLNQCPFPCKQFPLASFRCYSVSIPVHGTSIKDYLGGLQTSLPRGVASVKLQVLIRMLVYMGLCQQKEQTMYCVHLNLSVLEWHVISTWVRKNLLLYEVSKYVTLGINWSNLYRGGSLCLNQLWSCLHKQFSRAFVCTYLHVATLIMSPNDMHKVISVLLLTLLCTLIRTPFHELSE